MRRFTFAGTGVTVLLMARSTAVEQSVQTKAVSEQVISAVAGLTETDPVALEPLYQSVDPDALDKLFAADQLGFDRSPNRVAFSYCGCDVVITGDGSVHVSQPESETQIN